MDTSFREFHDHSMSLNRGTATDSRPVTFSNKFRITGSFKMKLCDFSNNFIRINYQMVS